MKFLYMGLNRIQGRFHLHAEGKIELQHVIGGFKSDGSQQVRPRFWQKRLVALPSCRTAAILIIKSAGTTEEEVC